MADYLKKMGSFADYNGSTANVPGVTVFEDSDAVKYSTEFHEFDPKYLFSDLTTSTDLSDLPSGGSVIGIEVIPASVAPNGKARYMSVKNMSWEDPENGTTATGNDASTNKGAAIPWGNYNDPIAELPEYENYPRSLKVVNDVPQEEIDFENGHDALYNPCDIDWSGEGYLQYLFDHRNGYYWGGESSYLLPAITTHSGLKLNPLFLQPNTWTMDWDGKKNTKVLINRIKGDAWKSGALSLDVGDAEEVSYCNHPAATACYRFNAGVSSLSGKWYLPAIAELACMWENIWKINGKIADVIGEGGNAVNIGVGVDSTYDISNLGDTLWSSSVYSTVSAWELITSHGNADNSDRNDKISYCRVRAFLVL